MTSPQTLRALNRLYVLHNRSLPIYLGDAAPWARLGDEQVKQTLAHIIEDHKRTAERLGSAILDRNGTVEHGGFPMEFTGWHDLSFDFLIARMIERQKREIAAIERSVRELDRDPEARALAEEILGQAKGHLDSLVELTRK